MNEIALGKCFSWGGLVLCDPDLSPGCKLTLLVIEKFTSPLGVMKWPGKSALCELTGFKMERIDKYLAEARAKKYLKWMNFLDEPVYMPCFPDGQALASIPDQFSDAKAVDEPRVMVKVPQEKVRDVLVNLYGKDYAEAVVDIFLCGKGESDGRHGNADGSQIAGSEDPGRE